MNTLRLVVVGGLIEYDVNHPQGWVPNLTKFSGPYRSEKRAGGDAQAWSVDGYQFYVYPITKEGIRS